MIKNKIIEDQIKDEIIKYCQKRVEECNNLKGSYYNKIIDLIDESILIDDE